MRSVGGSAQWMAVALSSDGLITSLSATAEQVMGCSAQELEGRQLAVMLAPAPVCEIRQMMKEAAARGMWQGEIAFQNRNGIMLRAFGSLLSFAGAGGSGFLLISAPLDGSREDTRQALPREISTHLRETVHELNNPLAVIMGFTQLILLDSGCEGKLRADMERVYTEMQRVVQTVEQLHSYALELPGAWQAPPALDHGKTDGDSSRRFNSDSL